MKLVILDRDGVINMDSHEFIKSPAEWLPIPGSLEAIARLTHAHYHTVVVTNQSGLARDLFDIDTLNRIHDKMIRELDKLGGHIDAIFFCPHSNDDGCACRKPLPGMFLDVGKRLRNDLTNVPAIGDSLRDIQAAQSAGARPILVRTGKGASVAKKGKGLSGVDVYDDLATVVDSLLDTHAV